MLPFELSIPAILGQQAGHPYYLLSCPFGLLNKLLSGATIEDENSLRRLIGERIRGIKEYVTRNRKSYALAAITLCIDKTVQFSATDGEIMGWLKIPMSAKFLVLDGRHRLSGILEALTIQPRLADDSLPIMLFVDPAFRRAKQLYADLQGHATKPARSQMILVDQRDGLAKITRTVMQRVPVFRDLTETAKTTISNRSTRLFTLSGLYHATGILLSRRAELPPHQHRDIAVKFWSSIAQGMEHWELVRNKKITAAESRKQFIHSHAVGLAAIAEVGKAILDLPRERQDALVRKIRLIDWSRTNPIWEGRALTAGRLSKHRVSIILTSNAIKKELGLELDTDERAIEDQHTRSG
jgi:DNA sulfur modification protein DndB